MFDGGPGSDTLSFADFMDVDGDGDGVTVTAAGAITYKPVVLCPDCTEYRELHRQSF